MRLPASNADPEGLLKHGGCSAQGPRHLEISLREAGFALACPSAPVRHFTTQDADRWFPPTPRSHA